MAEQQKKDSQIVSMVKEAHRVAGVALNSVHGSRLVENHEVQGLANALVAGRHVTPGASGFKEVDHGSPDTKGNGLLDDAYGVDTNKSDGNF
jgi:hypothetical protein